MIIKNKKTKHTYLQAANLSTKLLTKIWEKIHIGVTPLDVSNYADELCKQHHVKPAFKGVGPKHNQFQYPVCISVNDTVVHGIPDQRKFKANDVIKVDFGIIYQNLYTDHCFSVGLKPIDQKNLRLIKTSKKIMQKSLQMAVVGNTTNHIGSYIEHHAKKAGYQVVRKYVGHGIGYTLHDEPQIPAFAHPQSAQILQKGMVLCIEAQFIDGELNLYTTEDGWTVKTRDGSNSAMFEYMVVVEKSSPTILTQTMNLAITK